MAREQLHRLLALGCVLGPALIARAAEPPPTTQAVQHVRELLAKGPADPVALLPELAATTPEKVRELLGAKAILERAGRKPAAIPLTSYTLYREFKRNGSREGYQAPYYEKREQLALAVLAAWLGKSDKPIDRINDLIWNICEETSWVIPAHESVGEIDLMASETGSQLAFTDLLLGTRLPKEIRNRIRAEIARRIFDPYLDHGTRFWWNNGANNWTGVCAGSVGQTFLILETDADRLARGLALAIDQSQRFLERAFEDDGASTEGIGYWNYGLAPCVIFAEMVRARTGGAIDLLASPKVRKIAGYPAAAAIGPHAFASFADSRENGSVQQFLAGRLAARTGEQSLFTQVAEDANVGSGRIGWTLCNLLWYGDRPAQPFTLTDAVLPTAGIAKRVATAAGKPLVVIAKAGHNAEQHNHNDIGSFIVRVGDTTYLCDPGSGLYDASYFGAKRYDNVFANSYGHSVPRIGGKLQQPGAKHRGSLDAVTGGDIRITFHEAYGLPALTSLRRTFRIDGNGTIAMEDAFAFSGTGLEVEEAFLTWHDVTVDGPTARVVAKDGELVLRSDRGTFAAERLVDACKANHKNDVLTRVTVTYPPSATLQARFTMTYKPAR